MPNHHNHESHTITGNTPAVRCQASLTRRTMTRRVGAALTIAALACLPTMALTGCLIGSKKSVQVTGRSFDPSLLNQVVVDQTTEIQLLDLLGPPTRTMAADAGGVIFIWEYRRVEDSRGYVLFVFGGSTERVEQQSVSVLVRDGLVRRVWQN
ncbi:MAG: hypothetical protein ACTS3F_06170 [Phycisphaerales bacterium]